MPLKKCTPNIGGANIGAITGILLSPSLLKIGLNSLKIRGYRKKWGKNLPARRIFSLDT
jgi:hypothetical protein